jgi:CubicO group peptidase (beta-lactamase class C family)
MRFTPAVPIRAARLPLILVLALSLPVSRSRADAASDAGDALNAKLRAISEAVDLKREELHIPGASLAVVKDDKVILLTAFGDRDVQNRLPVTPDTLFAIGSSTKAFTAMTVMMSADEGKLHLTDSPRKYLPYFKLHDSDADQKITISDILSHRSGLNRTDLAWYTGKLKPAEIIRVAGMAKPTAKLGEKFQYQNVMFLAAGEIVAKVQKVSWTAFVSRRLFRPLGMESTNLSVPVTLDAPDHSLGYTWDEDTKKLVRLPMRDIVCVAPAGAINSNARDMAQWVRFLLNGGAVNGKRLVSEKGFAELTEKRIALAPTVGYGYGWFLRDWHGHKVVEHGGNIDGFNAQVALMPDQHLGFVLLTNVSASPLGTQTMETVWSNLVDLPAGQKPATSSSIASGPAVSPDKEVGKYTLAIARMTFEVTQRDGTLRLVIPGQPTATLVPAGGRRYKLTGPFPDGFYLTFRDSSANPPAPEALLEQPQGNVVLVKEKTVAFAGPMTIDDLMRKQVEALGGEAALRSRKSMVLRFDVAMEDQGVTGAGTEWYDGAGRHAQTIVLSAAGRRIAEMRDYCDGKAAGSETTFTLPDIKAGSKLKDEVVDSTLWPDLAWKTLYKTVAITRMDKVAGEDAYVVEKKTASGRTTTDYISAKSFLVVKRDAAGSSQSLGDYRDAAGVKIPFTRITTTPTGARNVMTIREVKFNVHPSPRVFEPSTLGQAPRTTAHPKSPWA